MSKVKLITDGSCLGNPGPGGWAYILRYGEHVKEMAGGEAHTTNNRMELMAAIQGLLTLKRACEVELITDSQYLKKGVNDWMPKWKRNGWLTADKKPVVNRDLWERLDMLVVRHQIEWVWIKGHATHTDNNRCDEMAQAAARQVRDASRM